MIIVFMILPFVVGIVVTMFVLSERDPNEKVIQYLMKTYGWSHEQATAEFEIFNGYERKKDVQVTIDEHRVYKK